jgi:RimJ/RimL family protein N-acetyltransferase
MAELLAHPDVMRFYPACCTRDEAEDWIRRQQQRYARHGFGFWLAVEKDTGRPAGQVGLMVQSLQGSDAVGLGYMLHRPFWGRGLATEGAVACRDYLFGRLGYQGDLVCLARPENATSQAVARRLAMFPDGTTIYGGFTHRVFRLHPPGRGHGPGREV